MCACPSRARGDTYAEDFRFEHGVATKVLKPRTPGVMGPRAACAIAHLAGTALGEPFASPADESRRQGPRAYSCSGFLPPMVFSLANTASTLRSSRCFSVGSNSGSLRVVSEGGSRVAPP